MAEFDIKTLMKSKQDILTANLSVLLSHPTTKGEHCEAAWIDFFRSFLPSKYAVDKGFVFDHNGKVSEQIDIIIYDALYSPLVFGTESGEKFVTAESVYAIFECKQEIDKDNLKYANKKIKSVTCLERTSRGIIVAGEERDPRSLTHILGGILATSSAIESETIKKHMKEYPAIDLGCASQDLSFHVERTENEEPKLTISSGENVILNFFFLLLDELYKLGTTPAIDIREYAKAADSPFFSESAEPKP